MTKSNLNFIIVLFLTSSLFLNLTLEAQSKNDVATVEPVPVTVIVTGTRSYADFNVIAQNIKKVAGVKNLIESVASQNHIELTGLYLGDTDSLISDIESLSQDRFTTRSKKDKNRGIIVTLRKIR